ncbi:hypothetical protein BH11ARM2_BH11ARM2_24810 [soil metagenome]
MEDGPEEASGSDPRPPVAEARSFTGWIVLAVMFVFFIGLSLVNTEKRAEKKERSWAQEQVQLSTGVGARAASRLAPASGLQSDDTIRGVYDEAKKAHGSDLMAVRLRLVAGRVLKEKAAPSDLKLLAKSPVDADRALSEGLAQPKLQASRAKQLAGRIPAEPYVYKLGAAEIREAGGAKGAIDATVSTFKQFSRIVAGLLVVGVGLAGLVAWLFFWQLRANGLRPLGPPIPALTPTDADRLAIRAAQLFGGFILISNILGIILYRAPEGVGTLATAATMLAFVFFIMRRPVMGKPITLPYIGIKGPGVPRLIAYGVFGFLLELPVSILLALVGTKIFSFLPAPEHPATNSLMNSPSLLTMGATFFFAAVVAPFWEESMFRGLLFPAISRISKSPWIGGLVSCLLFASIHPQGIPLWLALGSVAAFSCTLTLYTKSLWPSVVMHALHNGTLILIQILFT